MKQVKNAKFVCKRLLGTFPSLFGVVVLTFLLSHALPGDPAAYFAGPAANAASIAQIRQRLGLNESIPHQFVEYVIALLHGNLGQSLSTGQPVIEDLLARLPASLELTGFALLFAIGFAIPMGILSAVRINSPLDHLCRAAVTICAAFPTFFVALLMVYIFYYLLGVSPEPLGRLNEIAYSPPPHITGAYTIDSILTGRWGVFRATLAQLVLPSISLGFFALAPIARITRATMVQALSSEYVRTARASGLRKSTVLFTYAFRNALTPVANMLGMVFSFLLGSNVLIEQVFGWQGVGSYAVSAVVASDYAAVQGFVLMMAILYVFLNLVVDLAVAMIDPRVRLEG
jgi:ABC-type dipeptide/oligopeptide/nickel transport system permease component